MIAPLATFSEQPVDNINNVLSCIADNKPNQTCSHDSATFMQVSLKKILGKYCFFKSSRYDYSYIFGKKQ